MDAGILTCSPTATALALDDLPDRGLFFRTAPSDSLQAIAIAEQAERTGALSAVVVYLDDAYGRPLADATIGALRGRGLTVDDPIGFTADDEILEDEATAVTESDAGVIVVLADAEQGARMIAAIGDATAEGPGEDVPTIIVNDALRRPPPSPQVITALAPSLRERVIGVSPLATVGRPGRAARRVRRQRLRLHEPDRPRRRRRPAATTPRRWPPRSARSARAAGRAGCSPSASSCRTPTATSTTTDPPVRCRSGPTATRPGRGYDRWGWNDKGVDVSLPMGPLAVSSG